MARPGSLRYIRGDRYAQARELDYLLNFLAFDQKQVLPATLVFMLRFIPRRVAQRPPTPRERSKTMDGRPASSSARAQANPATPAPTTTVSTLRVVAPPVKVARRSRRERGGRRRRACGNREDRRGSATNTRTRGRRLAAARS